MELLKASNEVLERLRGTVAVDEIGRPLVLHHGTDARFERFERTRDIGFHFGTWRQAKQRIRDIRGVKEGSRRGEPRIVSVALAARRPIVVPDDPIAWPADYLATLFRRFIPVAEEARVMSEFKDRPLPEQWEVKKALVRRKLLEAGFDVLIYRNQIESEGKSRQGLHWSWCVLDADVIVPLGDNVQAEAIDAEPGAFGVFPGPRRREEVVGLRHKTRGFVFAKDRKLVSEAVRVWARERAAVETQIHQEGQDCRFEMSVAGVDHILVVVGERVYIFRKGGAPIGEGLPGDEGLTSDKDMNVCLKWMPGEAISDVMERVEGAIAEIEALVEREADHAPAM